MDLLKRVFGKKSVSLSSLSVVVADLRVQNTFVQNAITLIRLYVLGRRNSCSPQPEYQRRREERHR